MKPELTINVIFGLLVLVFVGIGGLVYMNVQLQKKVNTLTKNNSVTSSISAQPLTEEQTRNIIEEEIDNSLNLVGGPIEEIRQNTIDIKYELR